MDTPFSKKLIEFFLLLSLPVVFALSFQSYQIYRMMTGFIGFIISDNWANILLWVYSRWLSWLWKQLFKKTLFNFAFLFFFVHSSLSLVNYRSQVRSKCTKSIGFEEFFVNLLASTPVFRKKEKLIFDFCLFLKFFM